jgi:hypothetical protein
MSQETTMRARIPVLVIGAASAALAASFAFAQGDDPAPPAPPKPHKTSNTCFYADQVRGFSAPSRDTVYLRATNKDVYLVDASGCLDIDWSTRIGIDSRGTGPWVCAGDLINLVVPASGIGPQRCLARVSHKLTEEELKGVAKKDLP